jgi:hypothetical protein
MEQKDKMIMLLLSCDKYSDVWDDFFNLKERFWPDCKFKWYLVTESKNYIRKNVSTIICGSDLNWAGRLRKAIQSVDSQFIGIFLEDYFIKTPIDDKKINYFVEMMEKDNVSFLNLDNGFRHILHEPNLEFYTEHLVKIPQHLRYGIDTSAAIWDKNFLLEKLGKGDYSAWKFESDRCCEAASEAGLGGFLLCDDELSFNVSEIPVIIQGKFYPKAIKYFRDVVGYQIQPKRKVMSLWDVWRYQFKSKMSRAKHGRKFLKWVGTHIMGYKFFTKD